MSALANTTAVLATAVANAGTVTISYPAGWTQADLIGSTGGSVALNLNDVFPQAASGAGTVAFTFNSGDITVTNNSGISWPANSTITVGFGTTDAGGGRYVPKVKVNPAIVALTAATGTASNTVSDVGASFNQSTLNNNFKSVSEKLNAVIAALKASGVNL